MFFFREEKENILYTPVNPTLFYNKFHKIEK